MGTLTKIPSSGGDAELLVTSFLPSGLWFGCDKNRLTRRLSGRGRVSRARGPRTEPTSASAAEQDLLSRLPPGRPQDCAGRTRL
jgi:hypothetical protein